jgi:hypothetical protein
MTDAKQLENSVVHNINHQKCTLEEVYTGTNFEQLIPSPEFVLSDAECRNCEHVYETWVEAGNGSRIPKDELTTPVWKFLEFLVKEKSLLVHGSSAGDIAEFEPRSASDNVVDGERPRVHASSSAIMSIFYAVLDRVRLKALPYVSAMNVAYLPFADRHGVAREGFHFAIDYRALPHFPWREGTIYVLPRAPFSAHYQNMQWTTEQPVQPLAKIEVLPADFPLLSKVRGIDWREVQRHTANGFSGFPWLDDARLYPVIP